MVPKDLKLTGVLSPQNFMSEDLGNTLGSYYKTAGPYISKLILSDDQGEPNELIARKKKSLEKVENGPPDDDSDKDQRQPASVKPDMTFETSIAHQLGIKAVDETAGMVVAMNAQYDELAEEPEIDESKLTAYEKRHLKEDKLVSYVREKKPWWDCRQYKIPTNCSEAYQMFKNFLSEIPKIFVTVPENSDLAKSCLMPYITFAITIVCIVMFVGYVILAVKSIGLH